MDTKNNTLEVLKVKVVGNAIRVKTLESSYNGQLYGYNEQKIILKPYYINVGDGILKINRGSKYIPLSDVIQID